MIKILHCSDLHIGSPVLFKSPEKASAMRKEIRNLISSLMLYVKADGIDLLLISGDLFDNRFITPDIARFLISEFASAPKCQIVISPGRADFISPDSVYKRYPFPKNVFIFDTPDLSFFEFTPSREENQKIRVYGYSYTAESRAISALPDGFGENRRSAAADGGTQSQSACPAAPSADAINVFCGQASVGIRSKTLSHLTVPQIRSSGLDYMAIGGDHNGNGVERAGKTYYGVSGCLCGHSFSDVGYKGAVLIEADKENGSLHLRARGLRLFKKRFACDSISADGAESGEDIKKIIAEHVKSKKYGEETALKIILTGKVAPGARFDCQSCERELSKLLFTAEIEDLTIPLSGYNPPENCLTLKDITLKRLSDIIRSGSETERKDAAAAFRIAYDAPFERSAIDDKSMTKQ